MKKKIVDDKWILIVDENPDILNFLEKETRETGLNYQFDKADNFSMAIDSLFSRRYDLVMLDFPGIRGPYLLNLASLREIPVVLLVTNDYPPFEAPYFPEKGIKGLLPKDKITEIIPALENLFSLSS